VLTHTIVQQDAQDDRAGRGKDEGEDDEQVIPPGRAEDEEASIESQQRADPGKYLERQMSAMS